MDGVKRSPIENSNSWPNRILSSNMNHTTQIRLPGELRASLDLSTCDQSHPDGWSSPEPTPHGESLHLSEIAGPRSLTDRPSHTLELIGAQTDRKSLLVTWSLEWSTPVFVSRSAACGRITQSGCSELCYLIRPLVQPGPRDPHISPIHCWFEIVDLTLKNSWKFYLFLCVQSNHLTNLAFHLCANVHWKTLNIKTNQIKTKEIVSESHLSNLYEMIIPHR